MTAARCIREVIDRKRGTMTQEWAPPIATVLVPIRTVSELNDHSHWRARQKRAKGQHYVTGFALHKFFVRRAGGRLLVEQDMERMLRREAAFDPIESGRRIAWQWLTLPLHVHLTRLAPRKLDTDNLAGALKHCRDAVAKFLGVDDGDEAKVTWSVGQEPAKGYQVKVELYRRTG